MRARQSRSHREGCWQQTAPALHERQHSPTMPLECAEADELPMSIDEGGALEDACATGKVCFTHLHLETATQLSSDPGTNKPVMARFWPWLELFSVRTSENRFRCSLPARLRPCSRNLIRTSAYDKCSGSMKIPTHLDHISRYKTASGTNWSKR
jgi:hypothetical protein